MATKSHADHTQRLREAGLRPTRQRRALAQLLFGKDHRHVTAEAVHAEARDAGHSISLATVYNTMHQFTDAGLLREVAVDGSRIYFDTNISDHHHFYFEDDGSLYDIDGNSIAVAGIPPAPTGSKIGRVDVIVRLKRK